MWPTPGSTSRHDTAGSPGRTVGSFFHFLVFKVIRNVLSLRLAVSASRLTDMLCVFLKCFLSAFSGVELFRFPELSAADVCATTVMKNLQRASQSGVERKQILVCLKWWDRQINSVICTLMHNPSKYEFCAHVWFLDGCFIFWNVEGGCRPVFCYFVVIFTCTCSVI